MLHTGIAAFLDDFLHRISGGGYTWWKVFLEMLLISVVVYAALRFLQGTRGARLMRAIGLIVVVSFIVVRLIAAKLGLDRINYVYPYFLGAVFLITLIVFQTELRRGLLRLGADWWTGTWAKSAEQIVDPVVHAAGRLSKKKVGALLAFERSVGIAGVAETGVAINGELSAELLESIFWPGSVLHDMGVIISQGRVTAAGCQFPLAESGDVDRSLGSRHRAAIGLSQESDALVVVVSEETGAISIAEHGRLRRSLTSDALRQALIAGLTTKRSGRRTAPLLRGRVATAKPSPAIQPASRAAGSGAELPGSADAQAVAAGAPKAEASS